MPTTRVDPLRNFRYRLEIDGIAQAGFSEVAIGETMTDAVDYREGTDAPNVRKLTGLTKYGNVTLKWGVTTSLDLYNWHKAIIAGQIASNRNAKGNEVFIETLELVNEGVERVQ